MVQEAFGDEAYGPGTLGPGTIDLEIGWSDATKGVWSGPTFPYVELAWATRRKRLKRSQTPHWMMWPRPY